MDLSRLDAIHGRVPLCQNHGEFGAFIEFAASYFGNRLISPPIVVELGVERGGQRQYYEDILGAQYIGVDISDEFAVPDIKADALLPETVATVREAAGGSIDLLFIDIDSRESTERAYAIYEPLVRHLIAIHNTRCEGSLTAEFWRRLKNRPDGRVKIEFACPYTMVSTWAITPMGIGVIIKS